MRPRERGNHPKQTLATVIDMGLLDRKRQKRVYARPSLSTLGVGPALVLLTFVWVGLVCVLTRTHASLAIPDWPRAALRDVSLVLLVVAVIIYVWTITLVRNAHERRVLVTDLGPYRYVRHPIYALYLFLVCPAFVMVIGSWPALSIPPVFVVLYGLLIGREEARLEVQFGDAYREYRCRVGGLVPRRMI
jgi:protein-S-isoprenylcysteine O-methyltransferase Ste14